MSDSTLISIDDAASMLNMSSQNVRKLVRENTISASRVGKQWVINKEDLEDCIKSKKVFIDPIDHQRNSDNLPNIVALSFFSGAMGLDIGLKNVGIDALLACEFNKYARMTINANCPDMALIGDINKYEPEEILKLAKIPKNRKVDVMFGGPPCQAFSTAGCRRGLDDERGNVFLRYLDIANTIRPRYLVIENVRGLLSTPYYYHSEKPVKGGALMAILDKLHSMGYSVSFNLYNAANYGAPQIRERVVMICKEGNQKMPYLTPTNSNESKYGLDPWRTFGDAVSVLNIDTQHHYSKYNEKRLKYLRMLKAGQYWKDLPEDIQKEAMGNSYNLPGGKTGFYRRISYDKPSPTLVTCPTMPATDLCHPTEDRPISVEEYSCVQGFPSDWIICGNLSEQYRQIGNAVPIKLAEAIGKIIIADMKGEKIKEIPSFPYSRYKNTSDESWAKSMNYVRFAKTLEDFIQD